MREHISRLQNIGLIARAENLLVLPLPFRVIDSIDPVLHFQDDAAVLLHDAGTTLEALVGLDGKSAFARF